MAHLLATLRNTPIETIKRVLEDDKAFHETQGMYLEHIWQNVDDSNEVLFLFKINSIEDTKVLIGKLHAAALSQDPKVNLPVMTYLK